MVDSMFARILESKYHPCREKIYIPLSYFLSYKMTESFLSQRALGCFLCMLQVIMQLNDVVLSRWHLFAEHIILSLIYCLFLRYQQFIECFSHWGVRRLKLLYVVCWYVNCMCLFFGWKGWNQVHMFFYIITTVHIKGILASGL